MLVAHLVPGYFAAAKSRPSWDPAWSGMRRAGLWFVALGSTVVPDLDVIYNALFRGFFGHTVLWTHSLIPHLGLGLVWLILHRLRASPYLRLLVGLAAIGGLSHLVLDVISHGTPLLYPFSMMMFDGHPFSVTSKGIWAYLTDPIFLLEPLSLALVGWHWALDRQFGPRVQTAALTLFFIGLVSVFAASLWLWPFVRSLLVGA